MYKGQQVRLNGEKFRVLWRAGYLTAPDMWVIQNVEGYRVAVFPYEIEDGW